MAEAVGDGCRCAGRAPGEVGVDDTAAHLEIERSLGALRDRYTILATVGVVEGAGIHVVGAGGGGGVGEKGVVVGQAVVVGREQRRAVGRVKPQKRVLDAVCACPDLRERVGLARDQIDAEPVVTVAARGQLPLGGLARRQSVGCRRAGSRVGRLNDIWHGNNLASNSCDSANADGASYPKSPTRQLLTKLQAPRTRSVRKLHQSEALRPTGKRIECGHPATLDEFPQRVHRYFPDDLDL